MTVPVSTDLAALATGFARSLRAGGLDAPASATIDFAEALALLGVDQPDQVFWAGEACFCRGAEDLVPYAETFRAFFAVSPPVFPRGRLTSVPPVPITRPSAETDFEDDSVEHPIDDTRTDDRPRD